MNQEETFIIIARGGYLKSPVVESFTIGSEDEEAEEFDSYEEYKEYILQESVAEFEQRLASAIVVQINEIPIILKKLTEITQK